MATTKLPSGSVKRAVKPKPTPPYERIWWRGFRFDRRTVSAIEYAEALYGGHFTITQGSYNAGGVAASAGVHDGGGAVDLSVIGLTTKQRRKVVRCLRRTGFAAWYRPPVAGLWPAHIHAVLLAHKTASDQAKWQWASYRQGRNGLANNAADPAWRPNPIPRWSHRRRKPIT